MLFYVTYFEAQEFLIRVISYQNHQDDFCGCGQGKFGLKGLRFPCCLINAGIRDNPVNTIFNFITFILFINLAYQYIIKKIIYRYRKK